MDDDTCPVLGCSTSIGDRLNQDGRSELNCLAVPERLLQRVLGHHPNGGIFELDSASELAVYGAHQRLAPGRRAATLRMVSGTDSTLTELTNDGTRQDLEDILACYPQARSVVLVPIWDPHAGQCLACCCVWSADPARHFTVKDDLGYLRAFGGAITFEFLRITSQLADASKNNLLESLSHELRSPLHGIVTSAELLHDTDLTAFQSDVLHSIESCGRTLIDVINHLLDYTKINRLANSTKEQSKNFGQPSLAAPQSPFESQLSRLSSNVEVDALVEETVESVFTGYRFLMPNAGIDGQDIRMAETRFSIFGESSTEPLAGDSDKETRYPTGGTTQEVSIYLDIVRHDSWLGLAQPGPLRRVIMNILGNSLKFTEKGFVHIQLDQEETVSGRSMKLTISDTGKGIDVEFLHRYLFEPFKQEDPLQPGTGLGLSLVSQILEGLGGSIHIESQKGLGTVAHIAVPFPRSRENADHDSVLHRHVSALKNLRVSLHELDHAKVPCLGNLVPFEASLLMRNLFENWLQLEVISSQSTDTRPDILVCTELSVEQLVTANAGLSLPPVVVICRSAMTAYALGKTYKNLGGGAVLVFISQP
jgi:signal transduction histidine kinase